MLKIRLALVLAAGLLTAVAIPPSAAIADPSPNPTASPAGQVEEKPGSARKYTTQDILRSNPAARVVRPGVISIAPGIMLLMPEKPAGSSTVSAAWTPSEYCDYKWVCLWEWSFGDGFGEGLAFLDCSMYNLGHLRYPDGAWVGPVTGVNKWNDRLSSYVNNQTSGTLAKFYNWTGSWSQFYGSWAFDWDENLANDAPWNNYIDAVDAC